MASVWQHRIQSLVESRLAMRYNAIEQCFNSADHVIRYQLGRSSRSSRASEESPELLRR